MFTTEFVKEVAKVAGVSEAVAKKVVDAEKQVITEELSQGGRVQIIGLGTFSVANRAERVGKNPHTNEKMTIPAKRVPKFSVSKKLKEAVE